MTHLRSAFETTCCIHTKILLYVLPLVQYSYKCYIFVHLGAASVIFSRIYTTKTTEENLKAKYKYGDYLPNI